MRANLAKFILLVQTAMVSSQICLQNGMKTLQCNYFPADIPNGISEVEIADFMDFYEDLKLNSSTFRTDNWSNVTHLKLLDNTDNDGEPKLHFQSLCFSGLKRLQNLHLNIVQNFTLQNDTFHGLRYTTTLDISGCGRLSLDSFIRAVKGSNILPALEELDLSGLKYKEGELSLDKRLYIALHHMNLKQLKICNTGIDMIRAATLPLYLEKLEILNLSYSRIGDGDFQGDIDLSNIKLIDLAFASLPKLAIHKSFGNLTFSKTDLSTIGKQIFQFDPIKNFLSAQGLNVSAVLTNLGFTSLRLDRCFANIDYDIPWSSKAFVARHNNVKRLDLKLVFYNHVVNTLEILDISGNGLEFLHPSILSLMSNLKTLDLSHNELFNMVKENISLFEGLLIPLTQLKSIILSGNNLDHIPRDMFEHNIDVTGIDLSNNRIDQVTFLLDKIKNLKFLDLRKNNIKYLNGESVSNLNSLLSSTTVNKTHTRPIVDLKGNPLSCSKCEAKPFLTWILKSDLVESTGLLCTDETGSFVNVTNDSIKKVESICERRVIIIATSVSMGTVVLVGIVSFLIIYRSKTRARRLKNEQRALDLLRKGQGQYEFAAFLTYSSTDEDFVLHFVDVNLSRALKEMTGIDRNLISTGDRNLRPGFFVLDETVNCLERSQLVIVVVSNAFCTSNYCHNELDQAYRMKKPIVLMFKEKVDEDLMMPTLRLLYKQNVRILCTRENGQYVLKTSWENVCKSMLDLIVDNL